MSSHPSLDRDSFETFLANAYAVHQSGLDPRSLSAVVEVQRLIGTDEFTVDQALHLIADRAVKVSNASGIAVALLEANQLVYRAGSGLAAADVGRHVPAVLSASPGSNARLEILRVENAQTDSRIEAEICRQFGAISLLILPIYQAQALAGVLQVYFSEAHSFLEPEVRAYRLMAGLAEEAIQKNVRVAQKEASTKQYVSVAHAIQENTCPQPLSDNRDSSAQAAPKPCESFVEPAARELASISTVQAIRTGPKTIRLAIVDFWRIGATAAAAVLLASAIWIAHRHHPAPAVSGSAVSIPNQTADQVSPVSLSRQDKTKGFRRRVGDEMAPNSAFTRFRIGPNEVDYIAEDVTVRHFTNRTAKPQMLAADKEVNIGGDVTVRYFSPKPTLSQTGSSPISTQTTEHPLPASK